MPLGGALTLLGAMIYPQQLMTHSMIIHYVSNKALADSHFLSTQITNMVYYSESPLDMHNNISDFLLITA